MAASGDETGTDAESWTVRVVECLRRGVRWLRDLHRGFAYTGHLPRRRD